MRYRDSPEALLVLELAHFFAVFVNYLGERVLEAVFVRTAVLRVDIVRKRENDLVVAVVVLESYLRK